MKHSKIFRILALALTLALLIAVIPAAPAMAAVGAIFLSPATGTVTSIVFVSGSGFTPGSTATVFFQGSPVASGVVSGAGLITIPFPVPLLPRGSFYLVTVTTSPAGDTSNTSLFAVTPQLILVGASSGNVGDQVTVSGNGFQAGSSVNIMFDATIVATVTASVAGIIPTVTFTVPASAKGSHAITGVDTVGPSSAVSYSVLSQITAVPAEGGVGDQVTVSGTGFAANKAVTITFDDVAVTTTPVSVTTGSDGSFTATFNVPDAGQGVHTIKAQDANGNFATATFTISREMTITPVSGFVGDQVTVSGSGFAGSSTVTIFFDNVTVGTAATAADGSFTATFNIPAAANGAHTVKVQDASGNSGTATYSVQHIIALEPAEGKVGDQVSVSGSGFAGSSAVTIFFDNVTVGTAATGADGSFTATFNIPAAARGAHTVKAQDASGNSDTATFTIGQKMSISPTSGLVGDQVTVSGSGFAGSSTVTIFFDNVTVGTAATAADGSFAGAVFNVPVSAKGAHTVKVQDANGNSDTATFTTGETMAITPASGFVGDQITASGTGFGANLSLTFYIDNESAGSTTTDADGSFSGTFTILASANGDHIVKALDSVGNSATATVATKHRMVMAPGIGVAGTAVAVSGSGFGANRQIIITFNGQAVATTPATIVTGADGNFAASFLLPAMPAGGYTVEVSDGTNSDSATITTERTSSISPISAPNTPSSVGLEMTISGTGFKADATITVTYFTEPVVLATTTTDSSGSFSVTFTIPASAGGDHTITVSDGVTTEEFAFVMESIAPVPPVPLLPPLDFKPKQPITFDWENVGDSSLPVTYSLQIARDEAFNDIVLEKTGLAQSQYILTEEEKLDSAGGKEPYRWRVRATDGAGNVGLWSGVGTFTVGFAWPGWLIHLWYGLGILAAAGLGFWLGRKTLMSSY